MRKRWVSAPNQLRTEKCWATPGCAPPPSAAPGPRPGLGTGCGEDSGARQRHRRSGLRAVRAELPPGGFPTRTPALAATSTSCCWPAPTRRGSPAARQLRSRLPAGSPGSPAQPCGRPPHRGAPRATLPPPGPKNFRGGGRGRRSFPALPAGPRPGPAREGSGAAAPRTYLRGPPAARGAAGRGPGARSPPEGRAGSAERGAYHGGGRGPRGARQLPQRGRGRHLKGPAPAAPPARGGRRLPGARGAAAPEEGEPS